MLLDELLELDWLEDDDSFESPPEVRDESENPIDEVELELLELDELDDDDELELELLLGEDGLERLWLLPVDELELELLDGEDGDDGLEPDWLDGEDGLELELLLDDEEPD